MGSFLSKIESPQSAFFAKKRLKSQEFSCEFFDIFQSCIFKAKFLATASDQESILADEKYNIPSQVKVVTIFKLA